ncbi:hypothetical protein CENSYa_0440 [Cenarchaeum symbiosum A]|uniref:Uncharacterized protein n=1 Tax=Cenarchaeum symbiosum (strain A) TaxID=414004 RepID=A0RUQ8_CENSY|nr:hypothetical protein CENSYa_0440 [Cenarchaeum symbiosum A]
MPCLFGGAVRIKTVLMDAGFRSRYGRWRQSPGRPAYAPGGRNRAFLCAFVHTT